VTALFALSPSEYGSFSVVYLIFAFGLSLQFSLVSDAWIRSQTWASSTWPAYSGTSITIATLATVTSGWVAAVLHLPATVTFAIAIAVGVSVWRNASRYYALAAQRFRRVASSDVVGLLAFAGSMATMVGLLGLEPLVNVCASWAVMHLVSSAVLPLPRLQRGASPARWLSERRSIIVPLLGDSLLMDAGAIGAPLLIAPGLGSTDFGIYRAVSNVALPVRLVLDPARSLIASASLSSLRSVRTVATTVSGAAVFGLASYVVLTIAVPAAPINLGMLETLTQFSIPTSLFVFSSFLGHAAFLVARGHAPGRLLMLGRVVQTLLAIGLPLAGVFMWDLAGAIWGFSLGTLGSAVVWSMIVITHKEEPSVATN